MVRSGVRKRTNTESAENIKSTEKNRKEFTRNEFMIARVALVIFSLGVGAAFLLNRTKAGTMSGGLLVVANQKEHTILVVDPDERRELAKIVVGVNGHEVMVSKDGRFAYVPIYGNSGVGRPGTDGSTVDVVDLQE